jgi:hypothetical protein
MAAGVAKVGDSSASVYGGELTFSVLITCFVAASGGLIFGYDIGISGQIHAQSLHNMIWCRRFASFLISS